MSYLSEKERETILKKIETSIALAGKTRTERRLMIEIIPQSMSTDVKIGIVPEEEHVHVLAKESIIDRDNYDF